MRPIIAALALLATCSFAADAAEKAMDDVEVVNGLVKRMADEDFDVREAATEEASLMPLKWAKVLAKLATGYGPTDPEVAQRLKVAVIRLFVKRVLPTDDRWIRLHSRLDADMSVAYGDSWVLRMLGIAEDILEDNGKGEDDPDYRKWRHYAAACRNKILVVTGSWGTLNETLNTWDVVTKIDGKSITDAYDDPSGRAMAGWGMYKAGQEYALTVRRPKNPDAISQRGCISGDDEFFPEVIIKVKAVAEDDPVRAGRTSDSLLETVASCAWREFVEENGLLEEFPPPQPTPSPQTFRP